MLRLMGDAQPFRCVITEEGKDLVRLHVTGHLTGEESSDYLDRVAKVVDGMRKRDGAQTVALLYLEELSGFESVKVPRVHGEFFKNQAGVIDRVAVVSQKSIITFAIAMAKLLVSPRQSIQIFKTEWEARSWLAAGNGAARSKTG